MRKPRSGLWRVPSMATKLTEEQVIAERVEDCEDALRSLERQLAEARRAAGVAEEDLKVADQRQQVLSPAAFNGDEEALSEFRLLDETIDEATRERKLAEGAAARISSKIPAAQERLKQARTEAA